MESIGVLDEGVEIEYLDEIEELEEASHNVKSQAIRINDLFFAEAIQKFGCILFQKKQTSRVKELKKHAVKEVMDFIFVQKNVNLSEEQIYKKLNNMKARVKTKQSKKIVKLNEGEKIILDLMTTVEKCTVPKQKCKCHFYTMNKHEINNLLIIS